MSKGGTVAVGKVVGVHGVKGEIKVFPYIPREEIADYIETFSSACKILYIDGTSYTLKGIKRHKGTVLMKLQGLTRREDAEGLIGKEVFVDRHSLPELPEGEYYEFELVGMDVFTEDGKLLGELVNVFRTGSNDVYEVRGPLGEVLLPAIDDVVLDVDVEHKRLRVRLLEGLLPDRPKKKKTSA